MVPIFSRPPISERPFEPRDETSYPWLQSADESSSSAVRSSARERLLCSGLWAARPGLAAAGDTHAGTEALGAPVDPKGGNSVRANSVYSRCVGLRPPLALRPPLDFWGRVSPGRSHSFRFEFGLGEEMSVSADRQKLQAAPETNGSFCFLTAVVESWVARCSSSAFIQERAFAPAKVKLGRAFLDESR